MSINNVTVSGNLTRDPELRMAGSTPLLQMGIAVNERVKDQSGEWTDKPNFFDVIVWGARGEALSRFLSKGSKVAISGRLRWSQWKNKEGENRSKVEIVAEEVDIMTPRDGNASSASSGYVAPAAAEVFTDDIPFF